MSLIVGYDTDNETAAQEALAAANEIKSNYCFAGLFYNNNSSSSTYPPAINAENLIFPAVYLREGCYRNMFYQYNRSDNSFKGGLNEGPCFLATDWNNLSGSHVNNTFLNVFNQCVNLKSAHFSFTSCPTSDDFNSYSVYTTPGDGGNSGTKTLYAPAGFNPSSCSIGNWNHTVWSYDPNAEPGGGGGESITPAAVNVYQAGTTDTTKILYNLPANAVDLGTGVAWATTDYDASTVSKFAADTRGANGLTGTIYGENCYCDPRTQITQNVWYAYSDIVPPANWRMPTQAEYEDLTENNTSYINVGTNNKRLQVNSRISNDNIQFSSVGYVLYGSGGWYNNCVWQDINIPYYWITQTAYFGINSSTQVPEIGGCDASCMMPARFVYNSSITTHTLTIIAGEHQYIYMCEDGQEITVTAVPDEIYVFKWWSDDHSNTTATRTFTMNSDIEVEAVFKANPSLPAHHVIFYDYDGTTILYQDDVAEGFMPVYDAETPTRSGYVFIGWDMAITVMGNTNMSYIAQYVQVFTITAIAANGTVTMTSAVASDEINSGVFKSGATVTLTVTPAAGSRFVEWNDGNTDNPRTITVTADANYTATLAMESAPAAVNVYQDVSASTTKILYDLSEKKGVDGNTYIPIDLGYGVAWADRNVGATSTESVGGYFRWGVKTVDSPSNITTATTLGNRSGTYTLVSSADDATNEDAATANMGPTWRMPTTTEYQSLINNTDKTNNKRFSNKSDNSLYIELPPSGYYVSSPNSKTKTTHQYYWTSQKPSNANRCYALERTGTDTYVHNTTYDRPSNKTSWYNNSQCHMPIRAIYVPSYTPCTLTVNIQGSSYSYKYLCQPGQTVTVTANATTEGYVFDKWTEDNNTNATRTFTVTGNVAYTATFKEAVTTNYYDITISTDPASGYGTVNTSSMNDVEEGTAISTSSNTLTIGETTITATKTADDAQYTYAFTSWTDNSGNALPATLTDDLTVVAHFTRTPNSYTLTWTTDGNALTGDYTNGLTAYGTAIVAPNDPTKDATAQYTYTFNGWSPTPAETMPAATTEYTATWTETKRQYTLTWDVNGGNALTGTYTNGTIDWGTAITKPADPTKAGYTFGGWDANNDGKADEVAETMPTTSLTYKAIWVAELPNITLCENCNDAHYTAFKTNYNGETVNVTYPRQFSASKWSTMCLPFSLDLATMIANKMYGRVYEFKYATGNANTNSGVNLYFSNAKKMEAGKCYIVNANDALAAKTSFVFSGVTIDLSKDNGAALNTVEAYNNLPGYKSEGTTIELVGTLRNGTLHGTATGNTYMGLKDNKIYYPNISQGSTIWAYRGIFRSSEFLDKESMQKMRIIVDGEDRGEIIIDADGDVRAPSDAASRKFIRDGVLYIEREGVVYDAQGKRVEGSF